MALEVADYAYVIEAGGIVLDGPASACANNPYVQQAYLGV
jgi:branched-chain amino acid transport system ATP-binding protein